MSITNLDNDLLYEYYKVHNDIRPVKVVGNKCNKKKLYYCLISPYFGKTMIHHSF